MNPEIIYEVRKFLEITLAELAAKKAIENTVTLRGHVRPLSIK
jgi:hypothetical protein